MKYLTKPKKLIRKKNGKKRRREDEPEVANRMERLLIRNQSISFDQKRDHSIKVTNVSFKMSNRSNHKTPCTLCTAQSISWPDDDNDDEREDQNIHRRQEKADKLTLHFAIKNWLKADERKKMTGRCFARNRSSDSFKPWRWRNAWAGIETFAHTHSLRSVCFVWHSFPWNRKHAGRFIHSLVLMDEMIFGRRIDEINRPMIDFNWLSMSSKAGTHTKEYSTEKTDIKLA